MLSGRADGVTQEPPGLFADFRYPHGVSSPWMEENKVLLGVCLLARGPKEGNFVRPLRNWAGRRASSGKGLGPLNSR